MTRLTRRYRFAASHRLHSPLLSDSENAELYGKCNNPFGHGHNYVLEVSVEGEVDEGSGRVVNPSDLDALVDEEIIRPFDHKFLNMEVAEFAGVSPTTENIVLEIERRLMRRWNSVFPGGPALVRVRVEETRRNSVELRIAAAPGAGSGRVEDAETVRH